MLKPWVRPLALHKPSVVAQSCHHSTPEVEARIVNSGSFFTVPYDILPQGKGREEKGGKGRGEKGGKGSGEGGMNGRELGGKGREGEEREEREEDGRGVQERFFPPLTPTLVGNIIYFKKIFASDKDDI